MGRYEIAITTGWLADRARHVADSIRQERQTGWFQRALDWESFAYEIEHPTRDTSTAIYGTITQEDSETS